MSYSALNNLATGLDLRIDQMKVVLSQISSLLGTIYGRVYRIEDGNSEWVPAVLDSLRGDYKVLTPDELSSPVTLLYPSGSQNIENGPEYESFNVLTTKLDIIYFADQRTVFPQDHLSHINTNVVSTILLNKLKDFHYFRPESVIEQTPDVYSMFNFRYNDRYYNYPFMCFRIRGELYFEDMGNSAEILRTLGLTQGLGENSVRTFDPCEDV